MPRNYVKWGDWNAICDVCGMKHKASEMKQRWDGLMVCPQDWEPRHPQTYIRVNGDNVSVEWTRPDPENIFKYICYIWARSAYADLAEADCAIADYQPLSYEQLVEMKGPPDPTFGISAIPLYAIPGLSIPGTTFPL